MRERREQELVEQIKQAHEQSRCRYGSPKIAMELKEQGVCVSRPRVARLMQKHRIQSIVRKKYRVQTTDSSHTYTVVENFLNRDFFAERAGREVGVRFNLHQKHGRLVVPDGGTGPCRPERSGQGTE
ncbi:IS3 family transposase [Pontibacter toksunensis]|uniref:IS3 family transposase n=1 Tax=Pontibacter toksunensis TaxID=1332631 RepID=A0ABW6C0Z8_9BACT